MKKTYLIYMLTALVIVALVSVLMINSKAVRDDVVEDNDQSEELVQDTEVVLPTESEVNKEAPTETTEPIEVEDPGQAPTPRAGLVETDPSTVNLASGDIQLVEFFAFW